MSAGIGRDGNTPRRHRSLGSFEKDLSIKSSHSSHSSYPTLSGVLSCIVTERVVVRNKSTLSYQRTPSSHDPSDVPNSSRRRSKSNSDFTRGTEVFSRRTIRMTPHACRIPNEECQRTKSIPLRTGSTKTLSPGLPITPTKEPSVYPCPS